MEPIRLPGPELTPLSGKKPSSLVILLHGYGADGNDLIGLAPALASPLPNTHFIAPDAPFPCEMSPYGKQWFSLRDWSPESMLRGAQAAAPALHSFIDTQLERFALKEEKLALVGFSQGTMMALYVALRRQAACAAVVGFSGAMIVGDSITSKPPVCLIHGENDNVVPFGAMGLARTALEHADIKVQSHARPALGHGIDDRGLEIAITFLKSTLQ